ncbi:TPA: glycosyltransferase, partial [Escherichia coli]|nr:glycosyltransferase [Escherichia coli]
SYYDSALIFLMTSKHEGYPLALAQAMWRCCFPVISENSGGNDIQAAGCAEIYHDLDELVNILEKKISNSGETLDLAIKARDYALLNNDWRKKLQKIHECLYDE